VAQNAEVQNCNIHSQE